MNGFAAQILNNSEAKKNYVRILSIAMIDIHDALKHEEEFYR